jgi:hypothetical protein
LDRGNPHEHFESSCFDEPVISGPRQAEGKEILSHVRRRRREQEGKYLEDDGGSEGLDCNVTWQWLNYFLSYKDYITYGVRPQCKARPALLLA